MATVHRLPRAIMEIDDPLGFDLFLCANCGWHGKIETHTLAICPKCGYSGHCRECDRETFDDERVANNMKCARCAT